MFVQLECCEKCFMHKQYNHQEWIFYENFCKLDQTIQRKCRLKILKNATLPPSVLQQFQRYNFTDNQLIQKLIEQQKQKYKPRIQTFEIKYRGLYIFSLLQSKIFPDYNLIAKILIIIKKADLNALNLIEIELKNSETQTIYELAKFKSEATNQKNIKLNFLQDILKQSSHKRSKIFISQEKKISKKQNSLKCLKKDNSQPKLNFSKQNFFVFKRKEQNEFFLKPQTAQLSQSHSRRSMTQKSGMSSVSIQPLSRESQGQVKKKLQKQIRCKKYENRYSNIHKKSQTKNKLSISQQNKIRQQKYEYLTKQSDVQCDFITELHFQLQNLSNQSDEDDYGQRNIETINRFNSLDLIEELCRTQIMKEKYYEKSTQKFDKKTQNKLDDEIIQPSLKSGVSIFPMNEHQIRTFQIKEDQQKTNQSKRNLKNKKNKNENSEQIQFNQKVQNQISHQTIVSKQNKKQFVENNSDISRNVQQKDEKMQPKQRISDKIKINKDLKDQNQEKENNKKQRKDQINKQMDQDQQKNVSQQTQHIKLQLREKENEEIKTAQIMEQGKVRIQQCLQKQGNNLQFKNADSTKQQIQNKQQQKCFIEIEDVDKIKKETNTLSNEFRSYQISIIQPIKMKQNSTVNLSKENKSNQKHQKSKYNQQQKQTNSNQIITQKQHISSNQQINQQKYQKTQISYFHYFSTYLQNFQNNLLSNTNLNINQFISINQTNSVQQFLNQFYPCPKIILQTQNHKKLIKIIENLIEPYLQQIQSSKQWLQITSLNICKIFFISQTSSPQIVYTILFNKKNPNKTKFYITNSNQQIQSFIQLDQLYKQFKQILFLFYDPKYHLNKCHLCTKQKQKQYQLTSSQKFNVQIKIKSNNLCTESIQEESNHIFIAFEMKNLQQNNTSIQKIKQSKSKNTQQKIKITVFQNQNITKNIQESSQNVIGQIQKKGNFFFQLNLDQGSYLCTIEIFPSKNKEEICTKQYNLIFYSQVNIQIGEFHKLKNQ